MKRFGGEPQDIGDAHATVTGAQDPIDWNLLRRATRRFGRAAADVLEQALRALIEAATLESWNRLLRVLTAFVHSASWA
jgi:hypothetical protein